MIDKLPKKYRFGVFVSVLAGFIGAFIPLFIKWFIDSVQQDSKPWKFLLILVGMFIIQAAVQYISNDMLTQTSEEAIKKLRNTLMGRLIYGQIKDINKFNSGEVSQSIINNTAGLKDFYANSYPSFIQGICIIVISLIAMFSLDWKLTVTLLVTLPLLVVVISFISSMGKGAEKNRQSTLAEYSGKIVETARETLYIKVNSLEEKQNDKLAVYSKDAKEAALKVDLSNNIATPLIMVSLFSSIAIIFSYGGIRIANGTLTTGSLISFLLYTFQMMNPMSRVGSYFSQKAKVKVTEESLKPILDIELEDLDKGKTAKVSNISVQNVSFSYDELEVLKNISMDIKENSKIAIVGPSGSGKSTLINLLLRMYEPTSGSIYLGEDEISGLSLNSYRSLFAYVGQSGGLISGSILDNLTAGLNEKPSKQRIEKALKQANLLEDINNMPDGLNTQVGESGQLLSGGQGQRLQIARAFLKDAAYIVFDEATSNLDADSEKLINESLNSLQEDATMIMIAHRLSTVVDSDCIYFLQDGKITGQGTHEELYNSHEDYKRYVDNQMKKDE